MATKLNITKDDNHTLPVLHNGQSCLVASPAVNTKLPTSQERASEWAVETRRNIAMCVDQHEDVNENDIIKLRQELIAVFITTLQQDTHSSWAYLCEVLQLLEGYREYLNYFETKPEIHHYLQRILQHIHTHHERLFDFQVEQHLQQVFPEEINLLRTTRTQPKQNCRNNSNVKTVTLSFPVPTSSTSNPSPQSKQVKKPFHLPDGNNPYSPYIRSQKELCTTKRLTFGDLHASLGNVTHEVSDRESVWNHCLGTTALAASTVIPEEPKAESLADLNVNATQSDEEPIISKTPKCSPRKTFEETVPYLNGRQAVQFFAGCHHKGKIKSLYFNLNPSQHFSPYDLVSVPKSKVNPEHYVFSTFGVLHVYPDKPSESLSLGEWQREAVLWKALSSIPFFKNYLITKMFHRWRRNKLYLDHQQRQKLIADRLLSNVPAFGAALLQVSRLLKELITVQILPAETNKTYKLAEFENVVNYKNIEAENILAKFFGYCKMVITVTTEESFKKIKYCEEQVNKRSFFSKDSLHLQKVKKEEREKNLKMAKREAGLLGNFVQLVDQMVVEHLFQIIKSQVLHFIKSVLAGNETRDGFFRCNLIFSKQDKLALSPSKEKFQQVLNSTLQKIPVVLSKHVIPADESLITREKIPLHTSDTKMTGSQTDSKNASHITSKKPHSAPFVTSSEQVSVTRQDQESSVRTAEDSFPVLELPFITYPTKAEDDLGVATPDLVISSHRNETVAVEGQGFLGQYSPLSQANLEDKLSLDDEYQAALKVMQELIEMGLAEIDNYCEFNSWLNEIHAFCRTWNDHSVREFQGVAAFTLEQKLTEIRQWTERVLNFDNNFVTDNGMFFVDCSAIHDGLLPRLNSIYQEVIMFVADEARNLSVTFCGEMALVLKNLKDKFEDMKSFATLARNYAQYKKNTVHYQQRVEYIKSLCEVIRMSYRQLTSEEEKMEEGVWASWQMFLMQMQDTGEFVNTQTPIMMQQLENTFEALEKDARVLTYQATSGQFLDPRQQPQQVLNALKELREKLSGTHQQLQEVSQWREAIAGEPYNLLFLNEMIVCMDVRQELWKYVEASTRIIRDWKQMPFRKINIKKALEKVIEWQSAADQLEPHLPAGDAVLAEWCCTLQDFRKDLPILHKLAHDALKERHWHAIFLGMNEAYIVNHQLNVEELLNFNLSDHAELIHGVYLSAIAEYDLEQHLSKIKKFWLDRCFKLAKHIPDSIFTHDAKHTASPGRHTTKLQRFRQQRAAAVSGPACGLDVSNDNFYLLIEIEELKYQLEDSQISVESMLQSPYIGDMQAEVEEWCRSLQEIEAITDLWTLCQKKWLYLLKIFEHPEMYRKLSAQAFKFEAVHNKFKDWMRVVASDSKVLSVVKRCRGEKGYRLLQGDNLRTLLLALIQQQEEILKELEQYLEHHRSQFSRLYFLSNCEMVDMLGISRNPPALLPFVRKCFPGVTDLTFMLPSAVGNSSLDFALHSQKLEAASVHGVCGEEVVLYTRVVSLPMASNWLHQLECVMKNTLTIILQACVQACVEEGTRQPVSILEELAYYGRQPKSGVADLTSEIHQTYGHWLLRFPVQCVVTAECIMWEQAMTRSLEKEDPTQLKPLRSNLSSKMDQYIDVLHKASVNQDLKEDVRRRLDCLLSSLIIQNIHHRDIIDTLLLAEMVTDASFDWLRVLKFRMDIRNVLRAKTTVSEASKSGAGAGKRKGTKQRYDSTEQPSVLSRTKTTVSTDFQFSPCYVQQLGNTFFYDYEYLGPFQSLVITPLTERAILSLTQSLKTFSCSTLIGQSGTGKTDTIKQLARMLGRCMFSVTCSERVTFPLMQQYLLGMIQSGCWVLFDDTDRLTQGLMSVAAQQLDYLHSALRSLDTSSQNQYQIRGQPHFDKMFSLKVGTGDKVIRRNSLTTLHPLPRSEAQPVPPLERQKTVPHGFNEKGLVTYFEDAWVAEREQRRHSIEREIEIKESDLYKSNKPPPLFYEHVKANKRRGSPNYSKLIPEPSYVHHVLGNIMFSGKLIPASANFGCFMTMDTSGTACREIPESFRILMRPCALIKPDTSHILSALLQTYAFQGYEIWTKKLMLLLSFLQTQLPSRSHYRCSLGEVKKIVNIATLKMQKKHFMYEADTCHSSNDFSGTEMNQSEVHTEPLMNEECCLIWAVQQVFAPRIQEDDKEEFQSILCSVFPSCASMQTKLGKQVEEQSILTAVKEVLKETKLMEIDSLMQKILQLHDNLQAHLPVLLIGPSGSGKSSCCRILGKAINFLNYKLYAPDHSKDELSTDRDEIFQSKQKLKLLKSIDDDSKSKASVGLKKLLHLKQNDVQAAHTSTEEPMPSLKLPKDTFQYPKVNMIWITPTAMDPHELLGKLNNGQWEGGLLGKILQDSFYKSLAKKAFIDNQQTVDKKDKKQQTFIDNKPCTLDHKDKKQPTVIDNQSCTKDKKEKKQQTELPSVLLRWIILDGDLDPIWTECIKTVYDSERRLWQSNGETVQLGDTTSIIFETLSLSNASPSAVTRCALIHFGESTMHWTALYHTWKQTAKAHWMLTVGSMKILDELIHEVFPPTLEFLQKECSLALLTDLGNSTASTQRMVTGVMEVSTFFKMFSSLLDTVFLREGIEKKAQREMSKDHHQSSDGTLFRQMTSNSHMESLIPHYMDVLKGMFAFAYVWSFGGSLHDRMKEKFSRFACDALSSAFHAIHLPDSGQVFDYYLDEKSGSFSRWCDRQQDKAKHAGSSFLITSEVDCYNFILDLLLSKHHSVFLAGAPGVGKTALVQHLVVPKHASTSITMSQGMSHSFFQNSLINHMFQAKSMGMMPGPGVGGNIRQIKKHYLFFIDDLNMASKVGNFQPSAEVLRQILSAGIIYNRQQQEMQAMTKATFVAAATFPTAPGTGLGLATHVLSSRLLRQFVNLTIFTPTMDSLLTVFANPLQSWLEEFPRSTVNHHMEFAIALILGLAELYQMVTQRFRPTPQHAHYIFSLHDVAKVVRGMLLMSPRSCASNFQVLNPNKNAKSKDLGGSSSFDSRLSSRSGSHVEQMEPGTSAPMMKVIAQLWCHECTRCFGDRLISEEDFSWFSNVLEELAVKHFCSSRQDPKLEMIEISKESALNGSTPRMHICDTTFVPPSHSPSDSDHKINQAAEQSKVGIQHIGSLETRGVQTEEISAEQHIGSSEAMSVQIEEEEKSVCDKDPGLKPDIVAYQLPITFQSLSQQHSPDKERHLISTASLALESRSETGITVQSRQSTHSEVSQESSGVSSVTESTITHTTLSTTTPDVTRSSSEMERGIRKDYELGTHHSSLEVVRSQCSASQNPKEVRDGKRFVTFKTGLLVDKEHETYYGPLLTIEEIKCSCKSLTDFIFSKHYLTCHSDNQGLPAQKGYTASSEEQLAKALKTCLGVYNDGTSQRLELVFFSQAVRHAARLSRVLAHPQGHALLLGMSYCTGRATLTRLAAYIAHCKLFEPKQQATPALNHLVVCEHIKRSCYHAGVNGKPTALLVHEDLGDRFLQHISAVMAQGTSPGLYSEEEIQDIASHMMPGGVLTKRVDKIEQAFERFVKRVRQNLHIVVCLNYKGNSFSSDFRWLQDKLQHYPGLVKNAFSIDLYQSWTFSALTTVANTWLQNDTSPIKIPWNPARRNEQIQTASNAMAYVHLSAKAAIERQHCHQKEPLRFYSPLTFLEFVHIFRVIAAYSFKKEREKAVQYEKALGKIDEAFGSIAEFKQEVSELTPKHKAATDTIQDLVAHVEKQKQDYIQALNCCKMQEEKIAELQGPFEKLHKSTKSEIDAVNPVYSSAVKALEAINRKDIDELKSYPSPPEPVKLLTYALCLMFGRPQNWEEGKILLLKEGFVDDLIFYDKNHIPDDIFHAMKFFVEHPQFDLQEMYHVSLPAYSVCKWVLAVYQYSSIYRRMQPHLQHLQQAQHKIAEAQTQLGQMRMQAHRLKSALEATISQHKEALKTAKNLEKHIQGIEKKIAKASNLMENMSMQHFLWRSELKKARRHILAAPGDALVTAACVCYHGPLEDRFRLELLSDWLDCCHQGTFYAQAFQENDPYSMIAHLELLMETRSQNECRESDDASQSEVSSVLQSTPQVRTFKYIPAIYDSTKFYNSELKKTDTMESLQCEAEDTDDGDEDDVSPLPTRSNFTIQDLLSNFDELSDWRMNNLPTDLHAVQNALFMRVSSDHRRHCWPLLLDPDNQAEMWVRALQTSGNQAGLFQEVTSVLEKEGIPLDKLSHNPEDPSCDEIGTLPQPPPSRGTALTFSTVTECSLPDLEHSTSSLVEAKSIHLSQHIVSGQMGSSDELRPVTSVTGSWDTSSHHVEMNIQLSDANLWIIQADDPSIHSKLINAIVHGMTVLVTHLELRPLGSVFRGLLLKQFYINQDGSKVVRIGDMQFTLHPNFRLYLSTSVPLFLKGDGFYRFPIHRMCIINLALSDEAIINRLLHETMKIECKEFEGQRRSNESHVILHQQQLAQEHEAIREKTLNLDGPLLEDGTILESLVACRSNVQRNKLLLEETRFMGDHLQTKFVHYLPMIRGSCIIYNTLGRMTVLHPIYYLPFYKFVDIFIQVIKQHDRGKGSIGAPQARMQELYDAVTSSVFRYASMMMFEQHYQLLCLLVSLERLHVARKASHKELSLFVNGFEKRGLDEAAMLQQKPAWMDKDAWIDCSILESLHHPLHGLCNSLVTHSKQWHEYFTSAVSLLNPVPGLTLQELSVFQKCILWKFSCPHRMSELVQAILVYELGSAMVSADNYNVHQAFALADQYTPVIFTLPANVKSLNLDATQGQPYASPVHEVKRLAREVGKEGKVRVMNFGVRSQEEIKQAVEDCIHGGNWLVLQNYHLAEEIEPQFFILLKELVCARWIEDGEETETTDDSNSRITHSVPSANFPNHQVHPSFRLWITTKVDGHRIIPGILIQHGLRVTCEVTANFRSTLEKSYSSAVRLVNKWNTTQWPKQLNHILPLALLHSILIQYSYYGHHAFVQIPSWTPTDLGTVVELFWHLAMPSLKPQDTVDLIASLYSNQCTASTDACSIHAIAQDLVFQAVVQQMDTKIIKGVVELLQHLLHATQQNCSLKHILDSIEDTSARTFSLPKQSEQLLIASKSRIFSTDLMQTSGAPELLLPVAAHPGGIDAVVIVSQLLNMLNDCPSLPLPKKQQITPLDIFFYKEMEGYRFLVQHMLADLTLLYRAIQGEISMSSELKSIFEAVITDQIPKKWLLETFAICRSVHQWVQILAERLRFIQKCCISLPASLWLPAFLRPDHLLQAVIHTYAVHSLKQVSNISLSFQVMSLDFSPVVAPIEGIYVHGLQLNNAVWDSGQSVLDETLPGDSSLQLLPPLWIRPLEIGSELQRDYAVSVYNCPLFISSHGNPQDDVDFVTFVPLPSYHPPSLWAQRKVAINCCLFNTHLRSV